MTRVQCTHAVDALTQCCLHAPLFCRHVGTIVQAVSDAFVPLLIMTRKRWTQCWAPALSTAERVVPAVIKSSSTDGEYCQVDAAAPSNRTVCLPLQLHFRRQANTDACECRPISIP
jgi:hypothetical protein